MKPEDFGSQRNGMGGKTGTSRHRKSVLTGKSRNQEVEDKKRVAQRRTLLTQKRRHKHINNGRQKITLPPGTRLLTRLRGTSLLMLSGEKTEGDVPRAEDMSRIYLGNEDEPLFSYRSIA